MCEMGPVTQAWLHSAHQALWKIQGAARAVAWVTRSLPLRALHRDRIS